MIDPNTIYNFYTSISIDELHKQLLDGPVHIPGNNDLYIKFDGEMNDHIVMASKSKKYYLLLYFLSTKEEDGHMVMFYQQVRTGYNQITFGWPILHSPREAFIRRYIIWLCTIKDLKTFDTITEDIKRDAINLATDNYAVLIGITRDEAVKTIEYLKSEMT